MLDLRRPGESTADYLIRKGFARTRHGWERPRGFVPQQRECK